MYVLLLISFHLTRITSFFQLVTVASDLDLQWSQFRKISLLHYFQLKIGHEDTSWYRLYFFEVFIADIATFWSCNFTDKASISRLNADTFDWDSILTWAVAGLSIFSFGFETVRIKEIVVFLTALLFCLSWRICSRRFSLSKVGCFSLAKFGILASLFVCFFSFLPPHFLAVPNPPTVVLHI